VRIAGSASCGELSVGGSDVRIACSIRLRADDARPLPISAADPAAGSAAGADAAASRRWNSRSCSGVRNVSPSTRS
jgi:hypothetical protein